MDRPTEASQSRGEPGSTSKIPSKYSKWLNRPSTIPAEDRKLPAMERDMLTIKPADPRKPCSFGKLPAEIREMIYAYAFDYNTIIVNAMESFAQLQPGGFYAIGHWPALLHVSRRVRSEAAYVHYSHTMFQFCAYRLNFEFIQEWVDLLPVMHRQLLSRNQNLIILMERVDPWTAYSLNWDHNIGYEIEDRSRRFGNVNSISGIVHKVHFLVFCRLSEWFLGYGSLKHNITWKYEVTGLIPTNRAISTYTDFDDITASLAVDALNDNWGTFNLPCVEEHANLNSLQKTDMKEGVLKMLNDVDNEFHEEYDDAMVSHKVAEWDQRMVPLKQYIEKW